MKNLSSLAILSATYLLTILLGLQAAFTLIPLMYPPPGQEQVVPPVVSNPSSPTSSLQLFLYILIVTAVMLVLIKYALTWAIKILLGLSIVSGLLLSTILLLDWAGLILFALLIILYLRRKDYTIVNVILMFTIAGIGALLGTSLTVIPALILLLVLAVYDYISVYITKHMVTLGESAKGNIPLLFLIPVSGRELGLGTGDIAIPLTLCASILKDYGAGYAIPTAFGGLIGLIGLFFYVEQKKDHAAMPALPPITIGLLFGFGITLLALGF